MPNFSQKIVFQLAVEESCTLSTFSHAVTQRLEALWGCFYAFTSIPLETFAFIYLAIFLENSVAFFSTNSSLLSSTLLKITIFFLIFFINFRLTLHNLLRPFTWPHPLIFNLPKSFLQIFDSPVPFIAGINKPYSFSLENNFAYNSPNTIFVDLDNGAKFYYETLINEVPQETWSSLCEELKKPWESLEKTKKLNVHYAKNKEEEICFPIFSSFEFFIASKIMNTLPTKPVINETQKKVKKYQ